MAITAFPGVRGAAISLAGGDGIELVAASDEWTSRLQEMEMIVREGPATTAYVDLAVVVMDSRAGARPEWQAYMAACSRYDLANVAAIPLLINGDCIGTLTMYGHPHSDTETVDPRDALAFANVAAVALLADLQNAGLTGMANPAEFSFHVAVGVVAERLNISTDEAKVRLRGYAFGSGLTLSDVAEQALGDIDLS